MNLIRLCFLSSLLFLNLCINISFANENLEPSELIKVLTDKTFTEVHANKDKLQDVVVARGIIREHLMPYVDVKYAAYKVIGTNLKNTNESERTEFTNAFSEYIIATYADALKKYTDQSFEVNKAEFVDDKMAAVKVTMKTPNGPDIEVIFKLRKNTKTNQWKVYDMVAEGISLLSAKQSELSGVIREKGIKHVTNLLIEHTKIEK